MALWSVEVQYYKYLFAKPLPVKFFITSCSYDNFFVLSWYKTGFVVRIIPGQFTCIAFQDPEQIVKILTCLFNCLKDSKKL